MTKQSPIIAPSILAADFARLGEDTAAALAAGADWVHFDVMDNHYVPNLTIGPLVCEALRKHGVTAPIDVHLMVEPVDALIPMFAGAPSAIIGAAIGYLSLWSVYWVFKLLTGKEGMGHGDFKLLAALGAWMGPVALLPVILLSSLIGALVGGSLIALRKHEREIPMPFGPFIAAAGWVWFMAGPQLLQGYMHFTGLR